jgi:hypothetical protein
MASSSNVQQEEALLLDSKFIKLLKELMEESIKQSIVRALDYQGVSSRFVGNRVSLEIRS